MRRLHRSQNDRILFGVCGGLGEYFDVDPTIIRLIWAVAVVFGGTGILLYIIAVLLMPAASLSLPEPAPESVPDPETAAADASKPARTAKPRRPKTAP